MSRKHTPGDWLSSGDVVYALSDDGGTNRFAAQVARGYVHWERTKTARTYTSEEEIAANVALMKASPKLLAALERLVDGAEAHIAALRLFDLVGVDLDKLQAAMRQQRTAIDNARSVIAEARSEGSPSTDDMALRAQAEAQALAAAIEESIVAAEVLKRLKERADAAEEKLTGYARIVQHYQPAGSPPPGDELVLAVWVFDTLKARAIAAEDKLAELTKDCEEIKELWQDNRTYADDWSKRAHDAEARVRELEARLQPFAEFRATWAQEELADDTPVIHESRANQDFIITMGDLRRARAALGREEGDGK